MNTQPYISETASNAEVLRVYEDAMHPEIARRFEELITAEDSAEKLTDALCNADSAIQEIDSLTDDLNDLITECEDEGMEARTKKERDELRRDWCQRATSALDAVLKAIKDAAKHTEV